jgi:AraC family transcriptional regulator
MDTHTIVPPDDESRFDAIVSLLDGADRALSRNMREARAYIAGARALLSPHSSGGCVVSAVEQSNATRGGLGKWRLARATEFVENNLARPITLEGLARCVHLTRCHFARAFRCSVGETPHAYIVRRRIERAQQAMLSTRKPLSEIALECGLADQSHLTRLFGRLVGISPAAWRRLYQPVLPVQESRRPLPGVLVIAEDDQTSTEQSAVHGVGTGTQQHQCQTGENGRHGNRSESFMRIDTKHKLEQTTDRRADRRRESDTHQQG